MSGAPSRTATWPAALAALAVLAGCGDGPMAVQPKLMPSQASGLFADGKANQAPPPGTVARGALAEAARLERRPPLTPALLARGRERFDIYCSPCHGRLGDGNGLVPQRGFPHPPSFHQQRLRDAPAAHFLDVIENGYGAMFSYAARVPAADRWAIVAYIRALQLSQRAPADELPDDVRARLTRSVP